METDANRVRGICDAWMGWNESVVQSSEQAQALSRFYIRWGDLMRQANLKSCAYSFPAGNPEVELGKHLLDALRHCDYLPLHEYLTPTMGV